MKKVTVTTIKTTTTNTTTKTVKEEKREKKVFTLPGQKHEPPEEVSVINISFWNILLCKTKVRIRLKGFMDLLLISFLS